MQRQSRRRQAKEICPACGRSLEPGHVLRRARDRAREGATQVLALDVAEVTGELEALGAHLAEQRGVVAQLTKEKRALKRRLHRLKAR